MARAVVNRDFLLDVIIRNAGGRFEDSTYNFDTGELDVPRVTQAALDSAVAAYDDPTEKANLRATQSGRTVSDSAKSKLLAAIPTLTAAELEAIV